MKELKIGDEVEVEDGLIWSKRIFLNYGREGNVICVNGSDNKKFLDGDSYNTYKWDAEYWRPIKEKKIVPFDFSDAEHLIGKAVKGKHSGNVYVILNVYRGGIVVTDDNTNQKCGFESLLGYYTFLDGSPCGKEVSE